MYEKDVLERLYEVVLERKRQPQEGSYTCYLFDKGLDKILKKVGEESAETIIAAKNGVAPETVGEISDLIYHLMVLLAAQEIPLGAVMEELDRRSRKIGNLKQFHTVDRETGKKRSNTGGDGKPSPPVARFKWMPHSSRNSGGRSGGAQRGRRAGCHP